MTDLRVEIIAGSLVLSRTDCPTRVEAVRHLASRIGHQTATEGVSVRMPMDQDDFVTPDLVVLAPRSDPPRDRMVRTQDVELAVEVVPRQEKTREFGRKADWYAAARVRALLVVDPRYGTWALHTGLDGVGYRRMRSGCFGDSIPLPGPSVTHLLDTAALPVYRRVSEA